jgi:glycine/sarcosine N-methyltransferase
LNNSSPEQFYDELADIYDGMTNFGTRLEKAQQVLLKLKDQFHFESAIDVACGTGLHVCALERIGVSTTGIDISTQMLNKAKHNATQLGIAPQWIKADMANITDNKNLKTDAIFCLGNSIPHILDINHFYFVAAKYSTLLKKKGILVLQLLNYSSILTERKRIVNISESKGKHIIRFYDFENPLIQFNILTYWNEKEKYQHNIQSTKLFPYTSNQIFHALKKANFSKIDMYSSLELDAFDEEKSKDLIVVVQL